MDLMDYDDGGEWEREREKGFFSRRRISRLAWIVFVFEILANLVMAVAFLSPGWVRTWEIGSEIWDGELYAYYGLWWICTRSITRRRRQYCMFVADLKDLPDWWAACQGLVTGAVAFGILSLVLIILYIFKRNLNRKVAMAGSIIPVTLLACLVSAALWILFLIKFQDFNENCCPTSGHTIKEYYFSYSFYLCVGGSVFHLVSFLSALCEVLMLRR